jgi:Uma2 family endonuclease
MPRMGGRKDMTPTSPTKLTYDDFLSFPDDGQRHELIDGEHCVTPSPATVHQRLVRELLVALDTYFKTTRHGEVFGAPFDVVLSWHDVVEPDLVVVLADQPEIVTEKHVRGAPALLVEVLSPGTRRRDLGIKSRAYERCGVREYWLVDPDRQAIIVRRRDGTEALTDGVTLGTEGGHNLTSALLPGFSLAVGDLFARV